VSKSPDAADKTDGALTVPTFITIADAFNLLSSTSGKKIGKSLSDLLSNTDKMKAAVAKFEKQIKDTVEKGTMTDARYATAHRKADKPHSAILRQVPGEGQHTSDVRPLGT
jgi:hypothetical protein